MLGNAVVPARLSVSVSANRAGAVCLLALFPEHSSPLEEPRLAWLVVAKHPRNLIFLDFGNLVSPMIFRSSDSLPAVDCRGEAAARRQSATVTVNRNPLKSPKN